MHRLILLVIMALHTWLLADSVLKHSPTIDEGGHVLSGLIYWKTGTFSTYLVNPPLAKLWVTLPLLVMDLEVPFRTDTAYVHDWESVHEQFFKKNQHQYFTVIMLSRLTQIPLSILGLFTVAALGELFYGKLSGLIAAVLWATNPGILGWGSIVNVDLAAAVALVVVVYAFTTWIDDPTPSNCVALGVLLGLAQLTKFTLLCLYPYIAIIGFGLAMGWRFSSRTNASVQRVVCQLLIVVAISVLVINAGYGFRAVGNPLGDLTLHSDFLGTLRKSAAWIRVPVPTAYLLGVDEQKSHADLGFPAYLRGKWYPTGFVCYYLYAFLIKEPLSFLAPLILALLQIIILPQARLRLQVAVFLVPALMITAVLSMQTGLNAHYRYLLPVLPLLFVFASKSVAFTECGIWGPIWRSWAFILIFWSVGSALAIHPNHIGYFNGLVGGSRNGVFHLADSNTDWGQDLFLLRDWCQQRRIKEPIGLAYFGPIDPQLAGISYCFPSNELGVFCPGLLRTCPSCGSRPMYLVISANLLSGKASAVPTPQGWRLLPAGALSSWRSEPPLDVVGNSLYVFAADGPSDESLAE